MLVEKEISYNYVQAYNIQHLTLSKCMPSAYLKILYIHKNSLIGKYEKQHKFLEENKYLLENSLGHIEELNILMEESVKLIDKRINSENKILLELIKLNSSE